LNYHVVVNNNTVAGDVQELKKAMGRLPEPAAKPALIIVSGLPGTGKSYLSRKLAERLPSVVVESDALRKQLFPIPTYSAEESHRLFAACHRLIEDFLGSGISVILDATNLVEHHREPLYRIAQRFKARLILVQVEAPGKVVRERLQGRVEGINCEDNSDADWSIYQRMRTRVERISRNYYAVDTSRDITPVIDKIVREAKR
jgi:predicted kinase